MDADVKSKDALLTTRNVVFMAMVTAAMIASSVIVIPLVIGLFAVLPAVGAVATAFFFGTFLAVAYHRIPRPGPALFCSVLMGVLFVFVSPSIPAYIITSALVTDAVASRLLRRGPNVIVLAVLSAVYAGGNYLFGFIYGSLFNEVGFGFHHLQENPFLLVGLAAAALLLGATGGLVGAKIAAELEPNVDTSG